MGYVEDREEEFGIRFPYDSKESLAENFSRVDDMLNLGAFIAWHEPNALWGGTTRDEAFLAFCRLAGIEHPDRVFEIVRPDEKKSLTSPKT